MKSTKKVLIFSLMFSLVFGNFLFFSKIAKAENKPDLIVETLIYRENNNIYAGFPFDGTMFYLRVKNQGNTVAENFEVQVYIMKSGTTLSQCGASQLIESLGIGESKNVDGFTHDSYFDCANLENKDYYLRAKIDYNNQIDESNEDNNIKDTPTFHVWPNNDAPQIDNIIINKLSDSRTKISFVASGIINPIIRWSTDNDFVIVQSDRKYKNQESATSQNGRWYVTLNTVDGATYHYRILYDNNYYNVTTNDRIFTAELLSDFNIDNIYIAKNSIDTGADYIFVKFTNIGGDSETETLPVRVIDLDTGDIYSQNLVNNTGFNSGHQHNLQMNSPLKEKLSGKYRLKAEIDYNNVFEENNESNNTLIKTINISPLTCSETDDGKDYYTKGTASGVAHWGKNIPASDLADNCSSSIKINEMWCGSDDYVYQESYDCPYGCANDACIPKPKPKPKPTITKSPQISKRLSGKLLLDVDQGGAIWYVDHINHKRHNIRWNNALTVFQSFALGITDNDLLKIPAKTESVFQYLDTDGDGYTDEHELKNGYSPYNNKPVKFKLDNKVGQRLKGRFLLQVQKQGAIWYVDENGYRHSVRWNNLTPLFESLALGITNSDLNKIEAE